MLFFIRLKARCIRTDLSVIILYNLDMIVIMDLNWSLSHFLRAHLLWCSEVKKCLI